MNENAFAIQNDVIQSLKREGKFDKYRNQIKDKLINNEGYVKRTIDQVGKGADEVIQKRMKTMSSRLEDIAVKDELRSSVKTFVNHEARDQQLAVNVLSQILKSSIYTAIAKEVRQRMYAAYGLQLEEKEDEDGEEEAAVPILWPKDEK
ncbi:hypothetical protein WR25_10194 [Diploscapter pachys]|uniref:Uncharacterized protein n=1 Tax=Diploscapter pachys TaxID=2018661 RepID=A0A2A2KM55_9BILA|nr:hypothetical protein WR25_10194 [Diploscapter pachys]